MKPHETTGVSIPHSGIWTRDMVERIAELTRGRGGEHILCLLAERS